MFNLNYSQADTMYLTVVPAAPFNFMAIGLGSSLANTTLSTL